MKSRVLSTRQGVTSRTGGTSGRSTNARSEKDLCPGLESWTVYHPNFLDIVFIPTLCWGVRVGATSVVLPLYSTPHTYPKLTLFITPFTVWQTPIFTVISAYKTFPLFSFSLLSFLYRLKTGRWVSGPFKVTSVKIIQVTHVPRKSTRSPTSQPSFISFSVCFLPS